MASPGPAFTCIARLVTSLLSTMLCLRCIRAAIAPVQTASAIRQQAKQFPQRRLAQPQQQRCDSHTIEIARHIPLLTSSSRSLNILSRLPIRPSLTTCPATPTIEDKPTSSLRPLSQHSLSLLQVRGAKRDTFNPSHRVRKRRHGFLARLRTRTGRMVLKRRRAKGRNTMSH